MNKNLMRFIVFSILVLGFAFTANAQKRKTTAKTPPPPKVVQTDTLATTKSGAEKVSIQIKNSTKFLYVLGGVARVIEDLDREIAAGKASKNAPSTNARIKQDVMQSMRNLRAGLVQLETDFRASTQLRKYLPQIQGISDMSARAEDLAMAGQFTESGKVLLLVVEKLTDTLAAMP